MTHKAGGDALGALELGISIRQLALPDLAKHTLAVSSFADHFTSKTQRFGLFNSRPFCQAHDDTKPSHSDHHHVSSMSVNPPRLSLSP